MQRISEFSKLINPPISGLDSLLVAQVGLNQDIHKFIENCEKLITELEERVEKGLSAYKGDGVRVLVAGTPSPMGFAKIHHVVESSGMQIVVDESCTGHRYFRDLVDEKADNMDKMIEAIADRYFKIDCACFSPNKERGENILQIAKEYNVEGVVHGVLQYCHGFNVEAKAIDNTLEEAGIPTLKIVSDYSDEDIEQLKVRAESFCEIIKDKKMAS